jgi:hypothetical protein
MSSSDSIANSGFLTDVVNSLFQLASVILFLAMLVTINRLRSGFSAAKCLLLGALMFLFTLAVSPELRSLIFQDYLAPLIDSLFMPFRRLFEPTLHA